MTFKPRILFEDNHLLIVDKPAGWLVQGDKTGDITLTDWATEYIRKKYNKPGNIFCHPAHRLDRPVGGVVVFARTSKAAERLTKMFQAHEVEKTYLAEVMGVPEFAENTLVHWLAKDGEKNMVKAYDQPKGDAKRASLSYKLLATIGKHSLMMIMPKTGRPHQIRVQMKKIDCPIRGDLKYGYPTANQDKNISLHAYKISFVHPVKKEPVTVRSKPHWDIFKSFIHELD
jgi:23S rRNA pseudouridine1911/1915/1917 synthase